MTLITYGPTGASPKGQVNQGGGIAFDVGAALATGGGQFSVDSSAFPLLVQALDKYPGLQRITPGSPVYTDVITPVQAHTGSVAPAVGDMLVRGSDGYFAPQQVGGFTKLASAYLTPSGGDDSAAMASALTSFVPFAAPVVVLGPGTFQWNTQIPKLIRSTYAGAPAGTNIRTSITGSGRDQTIIKLSSAVPRAFDFNKVADYDTFSFAISDLTLDANNVNTGFSEHTLIGTIQRGGPQLRLNFTRIDIVRVKLINVYKFPNTVSGVRAGINLNSAHTASNEATQTTITDILIEDYECHGGNQGCFIGANNSGVTAGQGFNVFYDRIRIKRYWHDTGVIPTTPTFALEANLDIGSYAYGGSVHIEDFYGANSNDVGIEIDACQTLTMDGTNLVVDPWNTGYFVRNFRAPFDLGSQVNHLKGVVRNLNLDPGSVDGNLPVSNHFAVGGDATTAGYIFGHVIFEGVSDILTPLAKYNSHGVSVSAVAAQVRRVTVKDLVIAVPNFNVAPSAPVTLTFADIRLANAGAKVEIDRMVFRSSGTRGGTATNITFVILRIANQAKIDLRSFDVDLSGLAGLQPNDSFFYVQLDGGLGSTLSGSVGGIRCLKGAPASCNIYGLSVSGTGTCTIQGHLLVGGFDMIAAAGFGHDYNIDVTQAAKVWIEDWASARSGNQGPFQSATAITVGASPYTYTNQDFVNENVTIAGGTVSSVVLGQSGNVTVAPAGTYLLRPGDTLVVTYTAAPTMTKSPVI